MTATAVTEARQLAARTNPLVGWVLLAGGVFWLVGGPMHPREDPPGVSAKEHLRIMFEDPNWYPAHTILLIGVALIAAALVALARGHSLSAVRPMQVTVVIAAVMASLATPGMLIHLVAASEADAIAAHQGTSITDVMGIVETITVPAFGFSIAALAVMGAVTRTLGNPLTALAGVLGGVGFGLAGATILFTDKLDFLFPAATGIALWAIGAAIGLLLRRRASGSGL